jgi:hypothetical protein
VRQAAQTKEEKLEKINETAARLREAGHKVSLGARRSRVALLDRTALRIDPTIQQRATMDADTVAAYAELMLDGVELPPVVAFEDPENPHDGCWLADGFHREAAARTADLAEILTDLRKGTRRDALAFSLSANGAHGLHRSNADKRKAVTTALADAEWSTWSDREIAKLCGVSHPSVAAVRASLGGKLFHPEPPSSRAEALRELAAEEPAEFHDPNVPAPSDVENLAEPEPAPAPEVRRAHEPAGLARADVQRSYVADRLAEAGYKGLPAKIPRAKLVDWCGRQWLGIGGSHQGPFFAEKLVSVVPGTVWTDPPAPSERANYHGVAFTVLGAEWRFDANHEALVSYGPVPPVRNAAEIDELRKLGARILTEAQWERWKSLTPAERDRPDAIELLLEWEPEDDVAGAASEDPFGELVEALDAAHAPTPDEMREVYEAEAARVPRETPMEEAERVVAAQVAEFHTRYDALEEVTRVSESATYDSDSWSTPDDIIAAAREVLGEIDLDPATNPKAQSRIRATRHYTKEDDGLLVSNLWDGRVWLNPPYRRGLVGLFVDRLVGEFDARNVTHAILLVNNCTDTKWCQGLLRRFPACFTEGRVGFLYDGEPKEGTRQGQVLFYLGPDEQRFRRIFQRFGVVVEASRG